MNSTRVLSAWLLIATAPILSQVVACAENTTADSPAPAPELIEIAVGPGKMVRLKERSRTERTSTVHIDRGTSGSPTQDTFLITDAIAQLAVARQAKYFINLKEWRETNGDKMYVIGLAESDDVSIHEYFGREYSQTNAYGQTRLFMSASDWIALRTDGPLPAPREK